MARVNRPNKTQLAKLLMIESQINSSGNGQDVSTIRRLGWGDFATQVSGNLSVLPSFKNVTRFDPEKSVYRDGQWSPLIRFAEGFGRIDSSTAAHSVSDGNIRVYWVSDGRQLVLRLGEAPDRITAPLEPSVGIERDPAVIVALERGDLELRVDPIRHSF